MTPAMQCIGGRCTAGHRLWQWQRHTVLPGHDTFTVFSVQRCCKRHFGCPENVSVSKTPLPGNVCTTRLSVQTWGVLAASNSSVQATVHAVGSLITEAYNTQTSTSWPMRIASSIS